MAGPATIGLAAGGSGGHFFPAEALARALVSRGHRVIIYTDKRGEKYADKLRELAGSVELVTLPASTILPGLLGKLKTVRIIAGAVWQARRHMQQQGVQLLVAFGGYPSFAPALAAKSLRLPLVLHEQATKLSLANAKLLRLATRLATSFPQVAGAERMPARHVTQTGNPVRAAVIASRNAPYRAPDNTSPLHLLVTGGSQSASIFGEVVPPALLLLPEALRHRLQLSLQYVGTDTAQIAARLQGAGIECEIAPFFTDMAERLAATQLVITRAGASTAAELLVVGRPAIFVPIPVGGSVAEQRRNAESMQAAGVGWCLLQKDLTPESLAARLIALFENPAQLAAAAAAAHALGQPLAANKLANLVDSLLRT